MSTIMATYISDPTNIETLNITGGGNIDGLFDNNPSFKYFIFGPGNYYLTDTLKTNKVGLSMRSLNNSAKSVHIFQTVPNKDAIVVEHNQFVMKYLSIHDEFDGNITLGLSGVNGVLISKCFFYGNKTNFTVFASGPTELLAGQSTLDGYANNILDGGNIFTNNIVYTQFAGDSVSFSLQKGCKISSNIIRGGRLAIYMCKSSFIYANKIYDSTSSGIYVSLPSENLEIMENQIYSCDNSAIVVKNQIEHGPFITPNPSNINFSRNRISNTSSNALEFNDAKGMIVDSNVLIISKNYSVYLLNCDNLTVSNNKFAYFNTCLWVENSSNNIFKNNEIYSVYPDVANNAIKLSNGSLNNTFDSNSVMGNFQYDIYAISTDSIGTVEINNTYSKFYDFATENIIFNM